MEKSLGDKNGVFITSVVVRNEYFLHEGINDGAIAHHLFIDFYLIFF